MTKKIGRDDTIRTCDPLVPNQVLYQPELHPVLYNLLMPCFAWTPIALYALASLVMGIGMFQESQNRMLLTRIGLSLFMMIVWPVFAFDTWRSERRWAKRQ